MNDNENQAGSMTKCPDCGKEVSARATICPGCGGPLAAGTMKKCPDCGKNVSVRATSCPGCGSPFAAAQNQTQDPASIKPVNMGFSMTALPVIITLSLIAVSQAPLLQRGDIMNIAYFFTFIFAVFVGIEVYRNDNIKKIGHPFLWFLAALFFYPIVYPYYMFKRKEINLDSPLKWLSIPLALVSIFIEGAHLMYVSGLEF